MTYRSLILLAAFSGMAVAYVQASTPTRPAISSTSASTAPRAARGGGGGRVGGGPGTPVIPITASAPIRLNTVGYLPDAPKKASFNAPPAPATPPTSFTLLHLPDKSKILSGPITGPIDSPENAEKIYTADFSTLNTPGEYLLDIPGVGQSPPFKIAPDILDQPFYLVTRAMYLFRCGIAIKAELNGHTFEHAACHTDDAWLDLITGQHTKKPSTGGWHDAGDYNKYVVNAGISVGQMLRAWEDFPNIHSFKLDIPESGGKIPDFLAEVKYETDWLLTMQADDGSVYTKLTTMNFGGFNMPEKETAPRFFVPTGSAATADFVAMLAMMARNIRPYDPAYADQCLAAAKKSYNWLTAHPADLRYNHAGTTTGGYDTSDPDDRLWAAAELWQTIGDPAFLKDLEARIRANQNTFNLDFDWANVKNLALYTYTLSTREGRDPQLLASLRQNLTTTADTIVQNAKSHAYNRPLAQRYYWGCNGGVARQAMTLMAANRLSPKPEYRNTTLDAINHLFGRNLYGRSFVTGLGYLPPLHPHHRPSGADNFPWPGQLVGGAQRGNDWQDNQDTYNVNEVAINWNTALIYALAPFVAQ